LLQRTMVVVEGVARSLDPNMNLWHDARPVVENYIKESIGPKALIKDLAATVRVLAKFGPLLPKLAEDALIRQNNPVAGQRPQRRRARLAWMTLGAVLTGAAILLIQAL